MPTEQEISMSQQSLYDSAALRDDLNDTEATILLSWGEGQVVRIAQEYPDDFEQKNRFLRQVIKGINRFVGQREFNEIEGQKEYLSKVTMYFAQLGWGHVTEETILAAIPADKKDMFGTLKAILDLLSPAGKAVSDLNLPAPTTPSGPNFMEKPDIAGPKPGEITNSYNPSLEKSNDTGINQDDSKPSEE